MNRVDGDNNKIIEQIKIKQVFNRNGLKFAKRNNRIARKNVTHLNLQIIYSETKTTTNSNLLLYRKN